MALKHRRPTLILLVFCAVSWIYKVFTYYLLHGVTVLVELWHPHIFYVRYHDNDFLQGGIVSPTPNLQPGGPGYLS
jgi:hypothetical protein